MFPIEVQAGSLQADDAEIDAVAGSGKSTGEVQLNVGRGFRASNVGAEDLHANFRLPQSSSDGSQGSARGNRLSKIGEVNVVGRSVIVEGIHQHNAGKP